MDSDTSSSRPSNYAGGGDATVSSFITFIILLAGVLGGLIIVIVVILVCKYCVKGKKPIRRSLRDGSGEGGRAVRVLQRYETINSDVFSEPSSASLDGIPLSPRKSVDIRARARRDDEEINERTQLRSSYDKDLYEPQAEEAAMTVDESIAGTPGSRISFAPEEHVTVGTDGAKAKDEGEGEEEEEAGGGRPHGSPRDDAGRAEAGAAREDGEGGGDGGGGSSSRRVSFQLETVFRRQSQGIPCRRYTEGDFHYLKYAKITSLPQQFLLDAVVTTPTPTPTSAPSSASARRATPSLRATASDTAFRYSLDERLRLLQQEAERSFPTIQPIDLPLQQPSHPLERSSPSPLAERGGVSPREDKLAVSPVLEGASSKLRQSPPRSQRTEERWRRTPSASPSPPGEPVHRQVNVEVHYQQKDVAQDAEQQRGAAASISVQDSTSQQQQAGIPTLQDVAAASLTEEATDTQRSRLSTSTQGDPLSQQQPSTSSTKASKHLQRAQAYQKKGSHSLELVGARRRAYPSTRKVKSYEDVADYDVLQITEFSRGPFYNTDFDVISEMASPTSSKVRYNDTGSLEELQEEEDAEGETSCLALEALLPPHDPHSDSLGVCHQNRELWQLRATLEEEEECSDTVRMEDGGSPEDSPDREHLPPTSFLPSVPVTVSSDQRDSGIQWEGRISGGEEGAGAPPLPGPHQVVVEGPGPRSTPVSPSSTQHTPPQSLPPAAEPSQSGSGCEGDSNGGCCSHGGAEAAATSGQQQQQQQLLHPKYENRRQTYKNQLSGRQAKSSAGSEDAPAQAPGSANNSFDSVETDGEVSDTSRHEVTTTSFESTTDNTDSTTESQHSRLRQMKTDSGYKSLETQQSGVRDAGEMLEVVGLPEGRIVERLESLEEPGEDNEEGRASGNGHSSGGEDGDGGRNGGGSRGTGAVGRIEIVGGRRNSNAVHFERRAGRTASKKRREYSRERQVIHVYESVLEPEETASLRSESVDDGSSSSSRRRHSHTASYQQQHPHSASPPSTTTKRSVFTRFFSHGRDSREKYMVRDYSIDEKTNQIFNEFLRQETPGESCTGRGEGGARLGLRRSPRSQHRPRLQRKHTEPLYRLEDRRRDRLVPEIRSASLGSDSSAGSVRRLSPQDSIEEEFEEEGEAEVADWNRTELAPTLEVGGDGGVVGEGDGKSAASFTAASKAIQDIPIIKLPEEEAQDAS